MSNELRSLPKNQQDHALPSDSMLRAIQTKAPYLEQKLCRLHLADSVEKAQELFVEVKRYLILSVLYNNRSIPMFSARVDQAWHEFVLFTREYSEFCNSNFGTFLHHSPRESTLPLKGKAKSPMNLPEFKRTYESVFGTLSPLWFDERSVTTNTRLRWDSWPGHLHGREHNGRAEIVREEQLLEVLCRANLRALSAFVFLSNHREFIVRELPGLKRDNEKVTVCFNLVKCRLLALAL